MEVSIKAVGTGNELDLDTIREASRSLLEHFRREQFQASRRGGNESDALKALAREYKRGNGRVTDLYLAYLAVAYEELAADGRNITTTLSEAIGDGTAIPVPTVRTHIARARKRNFLSNAPQQGKEGGEATEDARQVIADRP